MTSYGLPKNRLAPTQDAFVAQAWDETVIAVMADGVGGARGGREAAQRAVETLMKNYAERPSAWSPQKALGEFTRLLNHRLYHDSLERWGEPELISTLCVAVIEGDRLFGLNVGDSRVYLSRGDALERLTIDDAFPEPERRHVLTRALGMEPDVEVHFFERDLHDGDVALLCTDGVSNVLDETQLCGKLTQRTSARALVSAARQAATPELMDDMSAVVLDVVETGKLRTMADLPLEIPETLARGETIDGFTLVKPFQQTDRVWLATRQGERCTVKFAPVEAVGNEALLTAFVREMWNATRLGGRYFPHAFAPERPTARFYAMEFIEAPTLHTLLKSRPLAIDEAVRLGKFLLEAGQYLLRWDLVHGDVKPENILVPSGYDSIDFKLIDFGSVTGLFSLTTRAGTASYLAPERFHESPISERTEIFAIGVTLYQALTGTAPYGEIERFQTPRFQQAKSPERLNPNVPPWLAAVLLRAVVVEPERRYQNFSEMLYELEHPTKVRPYYAKGTPLLERAPLRFFKVGFFLLLVLTLILAARLLSLSPLTPEKDDPYHTQIHDL